MPQQRSKPKPRTGRKTADNAPALPAGDRKVGKPFRPIKTRRIFEEICDAIRARLISGELKAGDRLPSERELSEMLDVSRTALREAIRSLEIAGIVEMKKGSRGGAFITQSGAGQVTRT